MPADEKSEPVAEASAVGSGAPATPSASAPQAGYWVEERPDPGLARGKYAWPDWGIAVFGGLIVALGVVHLATRYHRSRKR
ncbi:MAG TPA: hypothetical protein VI197_06920 [Polyangiaceae bacterium]